MNIRLLNAQDDTVHCNSIQDAEMYTFKCTENVSVKVTHEDRVILFGFNPNKESFTSALNSARRKMSEQKMCI